MLEIKNIGEEIASRELIFVGDDGVTEKVLVKIGKPYKVKDQGDYCCPYELVSGSHRKIYGSIGIDTFQALQLATSTINTEIRYWEKKHKGRFHFLGEEGAGLKE
jgi:hypothetical protein